MSAIDSLEVPSYLEGVGRMEDLSQKYLKDYKTKPKQHDGLYIWI